MKNLNAIQLASLRAVLVSTLNTLTDSPLSTLKSIKSQLALDLNNLQDSIAEKTAAQDIFQWSLMLSSSGQRLTLERVLHYTLHTLEARVDELNAQTDALCSQLQAAPVQSDAPLWPRVSLGQLVALRANAATPKEAQAAQRAMGEWAKNGARQIARAAVNRITSMKFENALLCADGLPPKHTEFDSVIEQVIVNTMLRDVYEAGYAVRLVGGDGYQNPALPDAEAVENELGAEEYETLMIVRSDESAALGGVWIMWGNGAGVISESSAALDEAGLMATCGRVAEILGAWGVQ